MRFSLNITQKFIGFLLLTSVIPLLLVGASSYRFAYQVLRREATKYNLELVRNQKDYLNLQLKQVESLISNISGVTEITDAVQSDYSNSEGTYTHLVTQARIGHILNGYTNLDGLVSIDIFGKNDHYHVGDTLDVSDIRLNVKQKILRQVVSSNQRIVWTGIEDNVNANSKAQQVVTAATLLGVTNPHTLKREIAGLLLVNYSIDNLYTHFSNIDLGKDAYLLVIDAKDQIIYHPNKALIGKAVNSKLIQKANLDEGVFSEQIDGRSVLVTYIKSKDSNWTIFSVVPIKSLVSGTVVIGLATSVALLLCFGVVLFAAWLVTQKVVNPIRQITQRFQAF